MFSWISKLAAPPASECVDDGDEVNVDDSKLDASQITASSSNLAGIAEEKLHLRTPSPPADSNMGPDVFSLESPTLISSVPAEVVHDASARVKLPSNPAESSKVHVGPEPTPESLSMLVKSVPAQTLHSYVLQHLTRANEATMESLAAFFASLKPPPLLHCVRCHKDYMEVENTDRSCLVPHDDESAEVERVSKGSEARRSIDNSGYETLWGCCGKLTEGDGSQGPPDGWCYEGRHTTDIKRARFRADSTPYDDKLVSCLRLNCHNIRDQLPRSNARIRKEKDRSRKEKEDESSDGSEGETDSGIEEIAGIKRAKRKKGKNKATTVDGDSDVEMESVSRAGSVRRPKSQSQADESGPQAATTAKRPRGRPRKYPPGPPSAKRPPGRPRKGPVPEADAQLSGSAPVVAPTPVPQSAPAAQPTSSISPYPRVASISTPPVQLKWGPLTSGPSSFPAPPASPFVTQSSSSFIVQLPSSFSVPSPPSHALPPPSPSSPSLGVIEQTPHTPVRPKAEETRSGKERTTKPKSTAAQGQGRRKKFKSQEFIENSDVEAEPESRTAAVSTAPRGSAASASPAKAESATTTPGSTKRPRRGSDFVEEEGTSATKKQKT